MRFMLRWMANAVSFYLALYLVDSLIAPRFYVEHIWVAIVLAVGLGLMNSIVKPLHRLKKNPVSAVTVAFMTVVLNTLVLQLFIWFGAPLSATHVLWVLLTGAFLSLLAGVLNWLIGFKPKERPSAMALERTDREAKAKRESSEARQKNSSEAKSNRTERPDR